ncbi:heme-degrading monooxygenase HmoA [Xanthomonas arboricola]|uniref:Dabb family protein n=1 Tax=Xanthomonas TaxID=338 RepID=UPI000CEEB8E4|nr:MULTISPECIES: Dabb family protein [Xanthomonas]MBB5737683.1 heme-degrading monooxygenase HmoA [Xanthomonas sp. CFBP 8152]PPT73825.1 stress responsive protein [Xanthomonas arboricola]
MIKHIVMWNVRGETAEEKAEVAARVKSGFEAMAALIPGLAKLEVGLDCSHVDYACDMVLYTEFESQEALDAYAVHPEHLRLRDALLGARIARFQVDYPVDAAA